MSKELNIKAELKGTDMTLSMSDLTIKPRYYIGQSVYYFSDHYHQLRRVCIGKIIIEVTDEYDKVWYDFMETVENTSSRKRLNEFFLYETVDDFANYIKRTAC